MIKPLPSYVTGYNSEWPNRFQEQVEQISTLLNNRLWLYHIGSTAVNGLMAKDCIDMLAEIPANVAEQPIIEALHQLGFEYRGEYGIKDRYYFCKAQPYKVHLHVFKQGNVAIAQHLHFVRVMAGNTQLIEEFNRIKQHLVAKKSNDKQDYQQQKAYFYDKIANLN